jgi:hypothetical protein
MSNQEPINPVLSVAEIILAMPSVRCKVGASPSAVENAIQNGAPAPGNVPGRTVYYDSLNKLTIVTDSVTGRVITAIPR